jgi:hypothetical protein
VDPCRWLVRLNPPRAVTAYVHTIVYDTVTGQPVTSYQQSKLLTLTWRQVQNCPEQSQPQPRALPTVRLSVNGVGCTASTTGSGAYVLNPTRLRVTLPPPGGTVQLNASAEMENWPQSGGTALRTWWLQINLLGQTQNCPGTSCTLVVPLGANFAAPSVHSAIATTNYNPAAGARDGLQGNWVLQGVTCRVDIEIVPRPGN